MMARPMNPLHKAEEENLLAIFRRVSGSAGEIASAEISDRPDVRGMLASGRPFGMEIATLTEDGHAQSDEALKGSFTRELAAACTAAGLHATFSLGLGDWQANWLVDKEHRARVIALLVQLTRDHLTGSSVMARVYSRLRTGAPSSTAS